MFIACNISSFVPHIAVASFSFQFVPVASHRPPPAWLWPDGGLECLKLYNTNSTWHPHQQQRQHKEIQQMSRDNLSGVNKVFTPIWLYYIVWTCLYKLSSCCCRIFSPHSLVHRLFFLTEQHSWLHRHFLRVKSSSKLCGNMFRVQFSTPIIWHL